MTVRSAYGYDSFVTDSKHLPKTLSKQYISDFKKALGSGFKVDVSKSESTAPRGWDYGNYTVVKITPPKMEGKPEGPINVAITLYVGDNFASGVATMDAPYGTVPVPRGAPEKVMQWLVDEVSSKLKASFAKKAYRYDRRLAYKALFDRAVYLPKEVRGTSPNVDNQGTDLDIWTYEAEGPRGPLYLAIAFQGKQSKPLFHYSYRTEADRNKRIQETIQSRKVSLDAKKKQMEDRRNFQHGLEVGAILYSSWGYNQTNVDFYEVTGVKGKQITIREIASKVVKGDSHSEYVVAVPGKFIGAPMNKTPTDGGGGLSVKINSSERASLWDGKPKYQTGPYGGH